MVDILCSQHIKGNRPPVTPTGPPPDPRGCTLARFARVVLLHKSEHSTLAVVSILRTNKNLGPRRLRYRGVLALGVLSRPQQGAQIDHVQGSRRR